MADIPWDKVARTQKAALSKLTDTVGTMVDMSKSGIARPDEVVRQVTAMATAMGDIAGSTTLPLEYLVNSQRQLAETLTAFATLQRQLAEVMETAAANQASMVQALELMTNPMVGMGRALRSDEPPKPKP